MNVLFLSKHYGAPCVGLTYSIPGHIEAQSGYDNVFWYNLVHEITPWSALPYYHDLSEYPCESVSDLPEPFNRPGVIVVEGGLGIGRIGIELMAGDIPYIIIPRVTLARRPWERAALPAEISVTYSALVCNAAAIQYLTEQEYIDSGDSWNKKHTVIPNVVPLTEKRKSSFNKEQLQCIFIGRISPYHKGLDLLVDACGQIRDELLRANCTIRLFGPRGISEAEAVRDLENQVIRQGLEDIVEFRDGIYDGEKEQMLLESDVFLMPSRFEGQPMSLLQALSYGLPCVVTTGSTMRDQVDAFHAGWTADNTSGDIARALQKMLREKDKMMEYSKNARRLAEEYSWKKIAEKQHEFYSEIADAGSGRMN